MITVKDIDTLLTEREMEVFRLMGEGLKAEDISIKLNIKRATVHSHIERMKIKLELKRSHDLLVQSILYIN